MAEFRDFTGKGNSDGESQEKLIAELSQLARSGPPLKALPPEIKLTAQAKWEQVKRLPIFMLLALIGVSVLFSHGGLPAELKTCGAILFIGLPLLFVMIRLNKAHRTAFVDNEIANGMSRVQAEKKYRDVYCD